MDEDILLRRKTEINELVVKRLIKRHRKNYKVPPIYSEEEKKNMLI